MTQSSGKLRLVLMVLLDTLPLLLIALVIVLAFYLQTQRPDMDDEELQLGKVVALVAISALVSCSVLEAAKRLLRLRGFYQQRQVRLWFADRLNWSKFAGYTRGKKALQELLLASGVLREDSLAVQRQEFKKSNHRTFRTLVGGLPLFDLPIEQLAAQVSKAVEAALRNHSRYPAIFKAMIGVDVYDELERLEGSRRAAEREAAKQDAANQKAGGQGEETSLDAREEGSAVVDQGPPWLTADERPFAIPDRESPFTSQQQAREAEWLRQQKELLLEEAESRGRASVDLLQISIGNRWRVFVSGFALGLSGLFGLFLNHGLLLDQRSNSGAGPIVVAFISIFAGGFLAWFIRDVSAGIERWRR